MNANNRFVRNRFFIGWQSMMMDASTDYSSYLMACAYPNGFHTPSASVSWNNSPVASMATNSAQPIASQPPPSTTPESGYDSEAEIFQAPSLIFPPGFPPKRPFVAPDTKGRSLMNWEWTPRPPTTSYVTDSAPRRPPTRFNEVTGEYDTSNAHLPAEALAEARAAGTPEDPLITEIKALNNKLPEPKWDRDVIRPEWRELKEYGFRILKDEE